jgi:virginiamycin B lyase
MRISRLAALTVVAAALLLTLSAVGALRAQTHGPSALTGRIASTAESAMEGVVVTANRAGSTIATSVVSDADGRYHFPAAALPPGRYTLEIRAVGYDLAKPASAMVGAGGNATADLLLVPTRDLEGQLSNAEWLMSIPGTPEQKRELLSCVDCHTLQRVMQSHHDAADWVKNVLPRMENYANMSFWLFPQPYRNVRTGRNGFAQPKFAAYLSSLNLSNGPHTYGIRTLPRPRGRATHVVVTEYALPNRLEQPHDVVVAPDGSAWYSDFGQELFGRVDPKSGKVTEYPIKELKPGYLTGSLDIELDKTGNLWLAMMYQGGIARFDPKTQALKEWRVQPADHPEYTQESFVMPWSSNVDGKVWTNNQDDHSFRRLDLATGKMETLGPFPYTAHGKQVVMRAYGMTADSQNNLWVLPLSQESIGRIDAKTGEMLAWPTPTRNSGPRRGRVDSHDVLWFAEYYGNNIGRYDTKAGDGNIQEFPLSPWTQPYDVVADKNGEVWTGSMLNDRVVRLDPTTGRTIEYLLPNDTNIRRVFVDNTTTPVTFWVGSNHGAAVVRVQPRD